MHIALHLWGSLILAPPSPLSENRRWMHMLESVCTAETRETSWLCLWFILQPIKYDICWNSGNQDSLPPFHGVIWMACLSHGNHKASVESILKGWICTTGLFSGGVYTPVYRKRMTIHWKTYCFICIDSYLLIALLMAKLSLLSILRWIHNKALHPQIFVWGLGKKSHQTGKWEIDAILML